MADRPVIRLPVAGDEYDHFLLEVIPTQGSKNQLDLTLLGTESVNGYEAKLRHRRIHEFKDAPGHCTEEEWEQILVAIFVQPTSPHRKDIEVKVEAGKKNVTLVFRKNISGITQRLGSMKLREIDDASENEIQLFDWCVAAITDRAKVVEDLAIATHKAVELEKSANELKKQLEDLLQAKKDDENVLLEKFRDLLNEKKLKIRQQQRLLAAADVDPARLQNLSGAGGGQGTGRKAKASRDGKRKTGQEDSDSDDGFEKMDVDQPAEIKNESEDEAAVNDRHTSDDEDVEDATASEAEATDEAPPPDVQASSKGKQKTAAKTKKPIKSLPARNPTAASSRSSRARTKAAASPGEPGDEQVEELPPRRNLPFQTRKKEKTPEAATPPDNDETETDDDEL